MQHQWIIQPDRLMLFLASALILTCTLSLVLREGARQADDSDDDLRPPPLQVEVPAEAEPEAPPEDAEPAETPVDEPVEEPPPVLTSETERRTAERAVRAVTSTYRQSGMIGLNAAIAACYARARELATLDAVEYCYVLDDGAAGLERAFADEVHMPPAETNTLFAVAKRVHALWNELGFSHDGQFERLRAWRQLEAEALAAINGEEVAADVGYRYDDGGLGRARALARDAESRLFPDMSRKARHDAIVALASEGLLAHAQARISDYPSTGTAVSQARLLKGRVHRDSDDILRVLNEGFFDGQADGGDAADERNAFIYLDNTTGAGIVALVVDLAWAPCDAIRHARHRHLLVSREDGLTIAPQDDVVLQVGPSRLPIGAPDHCATVVAAVTAPPDAAGAAPDDSMHFTSLVRDYRPRGPLVQTVFADGAITADTPRQFEAFVRQFDLARGARVVLNSPGGSAKGGINLGKAIRALGLHTDIGRRAGGGAGTAIDPGRCESSCALAYLGGTFRHLHPGSVYGVHRFSFSADLENPADAGQIASAAQLLYVTEMGADPALAARAAATSPDEIDEIPLADLMKMHVVTGNVASESWRLENARGRIYVVGERQDPLGTQTFMLLCEREARQLVAIAVTAMPDEESASRAVANGLDAGVRIDTHVRPLPGGGQPRLTVRGPSIWARWPISLADARSYAEASSSLGFVLAQSGAIPPIGFQISIEGGRTMMKDYARECFRRVR